ncbi:MAG: RNA polymerase sigma factor SigZ [Phaeodactylibacter sp.]|nr:RNA polymerase sigma factor SigZ [Phaeodactylibacter sp.]
MQQLLDNWTSIYPALTAFVEKRVKDRQLAADVVQDVFLKALAALPDLRDETRILPWLYAITRNRLTDHFRSVQRMEGPLPEDGPAENLDREGEDSVHSEFAGCVPRMLAGLPEKYATALQLVEIEGLSQKELAAHLGISYSGAKSRIQRARKLFREALLNCCNIATDAYGTVLAYEKRPPSCVPGKCED